MDRLCIVRAHARLICRIARAAWHVWRTMACHVSIRVLLWLEGVGKRVRCHVFRGRWLCVGLSAFWVVVCLGCCVAVTGSLVIVDSGDVCGCVLCWSSL